MPAQLPANPLDDLGQPTPAFTRPDIVAADTRRIRFFRQGESIGNAGAATVEDWPAR